MVEKSSRKGSIFERPDPHPERQVEPDPEQQELKEKIDRGLKDSFPASDPPSVSQPTKPGAGRTRKSPRPKA